MRDKDINDPAGSTTIKNYDSTKQGKLSIQGSEGAPPAPPKISDTTKVPKGGS